MFHMPAAPAQQQPRQLRQRNSDEAGRRRLVQALTQRPAVDARVDQHRHRADLEQREHQQEQFWRRPHHQRGADPATDPRIDQSGTDGVAAGIEFGIGQCDAVVDAAVGGEAGRAADGDLIGALGRQPRQGGGDVADVAHWLAPSVPPAEDRQALMAPIIRCRIPSSSSRL